MPNIAKLDLDSRLKETITYESQMLHYGLYTAGYRHVFKRIFPGTGITNLNSAILPEEASYIKPTAAPSPFTKGDGIFINSGVLHYLHPLEPYREARLQTQFFDKTFWRVPGSLLDIKYVTPVIERHRFETFLFTMQTRPAGVFWKGCRRALSYATVKMIFSSFT